MNESGHSSTEAKAKKTPTDMTLDQIALQHGTDQASSHHGYCEVYERYFSLVRYKPIIVLEAGVQFGCSIKTWLDYFVNARVIGIDVTNDFPCDNPRYKFYQGDQGSPAFWERFKTDEPGMLDIVIDDGPHVFQGQAVMWSALWPKIAPGGLYLIIDLFTWWHPSFNISNDGPLWLASLANGLNNGGRNFYGDPTIGTTPPIKTEIAFVELRYGLLIIGKK